jgi:AcrR family transcriptional regulator
MAASRLSPRPRLSAAARREQVLDAAVREFAAHGLHGARIEAVAARAGISHPYLMRLFSSKQALFLAAVDRAFGRVEQAFRRAVEATDGDPLIAMGEAYLELLDRHDELQLQLHAYAVAGNADVGPQVRERFIALRQAVQEMSGASPERVRTFFAIGLALTVGATLELPDHRADARWADGLLRADVAASA